MEIKYRSLVVVHSEITDDVISRWTELCTGKKETPLGPVPQSRIAVWLDAST